MEFRKRNTLMKYIEIFLSKNRIALKENKEYKAQLFSVIFFDSILFFATMTFYYVYGEVVREILNWNLLDFLLFFIFTLTSGKIIWFFFLRYFGARLLKGELNIYLTKPINPYFISSIVSSNGANIVTLFLLLIVAYSIIVIYDYSNMILTTVIFIIGQIYFITYFNFFASFAFFMKNSEFLINIFNKNLNFAIEEYTPKIFLGSAIQYFAFLMPSATYGFFVIESLNNRFDLLILFLPIIIISMTILSLSIYLIWHFGLKKYEGFD